MTKDYLWGWIETIILTALVLVIFGGVILGVRDFVVYLLWLS